MERMSLEQFRQYLIDTVTNADASDLERVGRAAIGPDLKHVINGFEIADDTVPRKVYYFEAENHVTVLRQQVECLKLNQKQVISEGDRLALVRRLHKIDEDLATHIESLSPDEIKDLIVNAVYK